MKKDKNRHVFHSLHTSINWYMKMDDDDREALKGRMAFQSIINLSHAIAFQNPLKASTDDKPNMGHEA